MCGLWVRPPDLADMSLAADREAERETRSFSNFAEDNLAADRTAERATRSPREISGGGRFLRSMLPRLPATAGPEYAPGHLWLLGGEAKTPSPIPTTLFEASAASVGGTPRDAVVVGGAWMEKGSQQVTVLSIFGRQLIC